MFYSLFKVCLIVLSAATTLLSFMFMFSPKLFSMIEKSLGLEFGSKITALEGEVNIVRDEQFKYRYFLGPLLALLSGLNTINAFFL